MKKLAWVLALGLALTTTGRLMADTEDNEEASAVTAENAYHPAYRQKVLCEARPVYVPGYYWWVSFNHAYSYNQALGACSRNHGACRVWCRVVW